MVSRRKEARCGIRSHAAIPAAVGYGSTAYGRTARYDAHPRGYGVLNRTGEARDFVEYGPIRVKCGDAPLLIHRRGAGMGNAAAAANPTAMSLADLLAGRDRQGPDDRLHFEKGERKHAGGMTRRPPSRVSSYESRPPSRSLRPLPECWKREAKGKTGAGFPRRTKERHAAFIGKRLFWINI